MRVLVCGGRNYQDDAKVAEVLGDILALAEASSEEPMLLIEGGCEGADARAYVWARENGVQTVQCKANWTYYAKSAGPTRNQAMLGLRPELVVAFPGGTGTADMVRRARKAGLLVRVVE